MLCRTPPKQLRDNRRQQVTVFRAKMWAVIRFNSRRNRFIARPWRGETTALLLFFVVHLSDLWVRSHHSQSSFFFFFFGAKSYQEKGMGPVRIRHSSHDFGWQSSHSVDLAGGKPKWLPLKVGYHDIMRTSPISRCLIDCSTHAWGFDASNPSWVKHCRMHRYGVAIPFFLFQFHYPLISSFSPCAMYNGDHDGSPEQCGLVSCGHWMMPMWSGGRADKISNKLVGDVACLGWSMEDHQLSLLGSRVRFPGLGVCVFFHFCLTSLPISLSLSSFPFSSFPFPYPFDLSFVLKKKRTLRIYQSRPLFWDFIIDPSTCTESDGRSNTTPKSLIACIIALSDGIPSPLSLTHSCPT